MKLEEFYKDRYDAKMRRYRFIVLVLLILLISIIYVVLGWRVVAALGIILVFIIGLLFGIGYLVPTIINPERYWALALSCSLYIGILIALTSYLFTLLDPKITGINSRLIASGKASILFSLATLFMFILNWVFPGLFPGIFSASKKSTDKLIRVLFRKA